MPVLAKIVYKTVDNSKKTIQIDYMHEFDEQTRVWTPVPFKDFSDVKGLQIRPDLIDGLEKDTIIESIDISPLSQCTQLNSLGICDTSVERINLTPLATCYGIQNIQLNNNHLKEVIFPIEEKEEGRKRRGTYQGEEGHFRSLVNFELKGNKVEENRKLTLDISPLFANLSLTSMTVDDNIELKARPSLRYGRDIPIAIEKLRWENRVSFLIAEDDPVLDDPDYPAPDVIKKLWDVVQPHRSIDPKIYPIEGGADPYDFDDWVTEDLLKQFLPRIWTLGWDLRIERESKTWGGILARAVQEIEEKPDGSAVGQDNLCLQYLFIWTRQHTLFSIHWWVIVPLFMTLMGLGVWFLWAPEIALAVSVRNQSGFWTPILQGYALWPGLFYFLLWQEIILISFLPYIRQIGKESRKPNPHLQPTIVPGIYGVLSLLFGVFPEILLIYFGLSVIFLIAAGVSILTGIAGHDMDYLPVFIWVKLQDREGEEGYWDYVHKATCWDYWHYYSTKQNTSELIRSEFPLREGITYEVPDPAWDPSDGKPVMISITSDEIPPITWSPGEFVIDNPWHSMRLFRSKDHENRTRNFGWFTLVVIIGVLSNSLLAFIFGSTELWRSTQQLVIMLFLVSVNLVIYSRYIEGRTRLITESELDDNMHHLSDEWLVTLWNLFDSRKEWDGFKLLSERQKEKGRESRLKVISKLEVPFIKDPNYWTTFHDDPEQIYNLFLDTRHTNRYRMLRSRLRRDLEYKYCRYCNHRNYASIRTCEKCRARL